MLILLLITVPSLTQVTAEQLANDWWSGQYYGVGAAWYDGEYYCVGIADGYTNKAGPVRLILGQPGAYYNRSYDAKYKAANGLYYRHERHFGCSKVSYEDALYRALCTGYCPELKSEENRFLKSINKLPIVRKND